MIGTVVRVNEAAYKQWKGMARLKHLLGTDPVGVIVRDAGPGKYCRFSVDFSGVLTGDMVLRAGLHSCNGTLPRATGWDLSEELVDILSVKKQEVDDLL